MVGRVDGSASSVDLTTAGAAELARIAPRALPAVLDGVSDGVIVVQAGAGVLAVNTAARELLGLSSVGDDLARLAEDVKVFRGGYALLGDAHPFLRAARGERVRTEVLLRSRRRPDAHVLVTCRPIRDGPAGPLAVIVLRDVSDTRLLDELLAREMSKPDTEVASIGRTSLVRDLRQALTHDRLDLAYQPFARTRDAHIRGVEALLRWEEPGRVGVAPDRFISIAEDAGLIVAIGEWVVRRALTQLREWDAADEERRLVVAVNASARQLGPEFVAMLAEELGQFGIEPRRLAVEITETALLADPSALASVEQLRSLGVVLSIDDFGTGYSSLARMRDVDFDVLKIDRSFVAEIDELTENAPLVNGTIALARCLGVGVVAEGVETVDQARYLCRQGCDALQGYLVSPPVRAEAVLDLADPVPALVQLGA